jgi:hypothetical protein
MLGSSLINITPYSLLLVSAKLTSDPAIWQPLYVNDAFLYVNDSPSTSHRVIPAFDPSILWSSGNVQDGSGGYLKSKFRRNSSL